MQENDNKCDELRLEVDRLDSQIQALVSQRDELATELIRSKSSPPYDPRREEEIAALDRSLWLPLLRRVRTAEGARAPAVTRRPGAFPEGSFVLIAGPCSVDDYLEETLDQLAGHNLTWIRAGAWKPRTFPWSFQGGGYPALRRLRNAADRRGFKIVSEIVSEIDAIKAAELVDVVQIGARNAQNFALLKAVARLGKPVLLKRGPANTVEEWLGSAAYLENCVPVTLCERGIRGFDPCFRNLLDLAGALLARRLGGFQTIIDPSHGMGIAGLVGPMVLAAQAAGLDGAMVEVHAQPSRSASDSDQALRPIEMLEIIDQIAARAADVEHAAVRGDA